MLRSLKRLVVLLASLAVAFLALARPVEVDPESTRRVLERAREAVDARLAALGEPPAPAELEVGAARLEIAPPLDWRPPMAGNRGLRFSRAEGVSAESVWARALAIRQGDRRLVLVSADIMVVHSGLVAAVLERLRGSLALEPEELMLVATHTHSGPGGYWQGTLAEISVGPFDPRLRAFLVERLAEAAVAAWRVLSPASLAVGRIELPMPIKNRTRRDGPENPDLFVLRATSRTDARRIDLVSYSAHPTDILKGNRQLTGDYPALMARRVDGPERTLVFVPGAIGDAKPAFRTMRSGRRRAETMASYLVDSGLDNVHLETLERPVLESFEVEVELPRLQPRLLRTDRFGSWSARPWLTRRLMPEHMQETVIQVVRLGRLAILGAPADLASSVALSLIESGRRRGLEVLFVSMTDDWIGYVLREEEYRELDYKETTQFHGPSMGPLFEALYERLIEGLATRASASSTSSSDNASSPS